MDERDHEPRADGSSATDDVDEPLPPPRPGFEPCDADEERIWSGLCPPGRIGDGTLPHRRVRTRGGARDARVAERRESISSLQDIDAQIASLTSQRLEVLRSVDRARDELWPIVPTRKSRRPPLVGHRALPPAAADARGLYGRPLRGYCRRLLRTYGDLALPELHALLHQYGYEIAHPHPVKALSDAMGHEVACHRAKRVRRGVYAIEPDGTTPWHLGDEPPIPGEPSDPLIDYDPAPPPVHHHPHRYTGTADPGSVDDEATDLGLRDIERDDELLLRWATGPVGPSGGPDDGAGPGALPPTAPDASGVETTDPDPRSSERAASPTVLPLDQPAPAPPRPPAPPDQHRPAGPDGTDADPDRAVADHGTRPEPGGPEIEPGEP